MKARFVSARYQAHNKVYRRLSIFVAVLLVPFVALKGVAWMTTYINVFGAAEAFCKNIVSYDPGMALASPHNRAVSSPVFSPGDADRYAIHGMITSVAELPRHSGAEAVHIDDGQAGYEAEVWPFAASGAFYPALTVPQHCAYSITELSWPLEVHVWLWGQRQVHWRQEFVGTPPVFELGAPYASHCFMRAHFNWWHWRIDFGQGYGSCGRDEKVDPTAPNHAEQVERLQGRHLGWGKRYREYVVR